MRKYHLTNPIEHGIVATCNGAHWRCVMANSKWINNVDVDTLKPHQTAAYHAWLESARNTKRLKEALNASLQEYADPGYSVECNNMRGTFNICVDASTKAKATTGKAPVNLAKMLDEYKANGRNV